MGAFSIPKFAREGVKLSRHGDATVAYGGETMSGYDATQRQRGIERKIRESKRKLIAYDEGIKQSTGTQKGELQMRYAFEGKRLSRLNAELDDFCRQTGMQKQYDRSRVLGFGRSEEKKAVSAGRKVLTSRQNNGIINTGGDVMYRKKKRKAL